MRDMSLDTGSEPKERPHCIWDQWFSKHHLWASTFCITWELVRNDSQDPPQTLWGKNHGGGIWQSVFSKALRVIPMAAPVWGPVWNDSPLTHSLNKHEGSLFHGQSSHSYSKLWKASKEENISNISLKMHDTCCEWIMATSDDQGQRQWGFATHRGPKAWSMISRVFAWETSQGHQDIYSFYCHRSIWWNSGQGWNVLSSLEASMRIDCQHSKAVPAPPVHELRLRSLGKILPADEEWGGHW